MGESRTGMLATIPSAALEESKGERLRPGRGRPARPPGARIGAKWVPARSKGTRGGGRRAPRGVFRRFSRHLARSCGAESMAAWRRVALSGGRVAVDGDGEAVADVDAIWALFSFHCSARQP